MCKWWFSLAHAKPDGRFSPWLPISPLFSILCFPLQVSIRSNFFLLLLICSINQLTQHLGSWFPLRFFTIHSSLQDFFQHAFTSQHMPYPVLFPTMNLFHYPSFFFHPLQDLFICYFIFIAYLFHPSPHPDLHSFQSPDLLFLCRPCFTTIQQC